MCAVKVCDCCGVRHSTDYDLCGTKIGCANRLRFLGLVTEENQNLAVSQNARLQFR